jgi:hypothetical protein
MSDDISTRQAKEVTILSGASVSDSVDLVSELVNSFLMPSNWTAASVSLEVSNDNVNWVSTVFDYTNIQAGVYTGAIAGAAYAIDVVTFAAFRYVRFRSGTAASPIAQGAARTITCFY